VSASEVDVGVDGTKREIKVKKMCGHMNEAPRISPIVSSKSPLSASSSL